MKIGKHEILRAGGNGRVSSCVQYNGMLFTSNIATVDLSADTRGQAKDIFSQLDKLLAQHNTDKNNILYAEIILQDLADLGDFNQAWDEWIIDGFEPTRQVTIAKLKLPEYKLSVRLQVAAHG